MSHASQLFIWDFDGVISDSLTECLTVVALASYRDRDPEIEIDEALLFEICSAKRVERLDQWMRPLRPFIVTGQDYLWQYFNKELFCRSFGSIDEYQEIYKSIYCDSTDQAYKKLFYESRKILSRLMGRKYQSLFTTYQGAVHALRTSIARHLSFICTARDRQALEMTLSGHQITIPREQIYSQDYCANEVNNGKGKAEQILEILDNHGGRKQPFVIIEDQVKAPAMLMHECPQMKVICAGWGYGLENDWLSIGLKNLVQVNSPADLIYEIY